MKLHVRADPVQQIHLLHPAHVGRAQRVMVRRRARWQQHLWLAHAVLHGSGDQLQGLDAGQHTHLGLGGACSEQQEGEQQRKRGEQARQHRQERRSEANGSNTITSLSASRRSAPTGRRADTWRQAVNA